MARGLERGDAKGDPPTVRKAAALTSPRYCTTLVPRYPWAGLSRVPGPAASPNSPDAGDLDKQLSAAASMLFGG